MMHTKRLLAAAITTVCASLPLTAFATNGDELIGLGAQSRALGGTGTAAYFGSENALINPALLGKSQGTEFAFGGTLFMPNVKASSDITGMPSNKKSDNDLNVIPEVSMFHRINDNWTFGIGMYGTAGMGVDYRDHDNIGTGSDADGLMHGYTSLQLMKFAPTLAYNQDNFGIGFAPVIQYGALDINYIGPEGPVGNGTSTDLGFGVNIGGYFDVNDQLTLALAYQSAIDMEYKGQLTTAADGFGIGPNGMQTITSNKLEQPAQIKLGVAYTVNNWLLTADYKQIKWGSANGYKTFNWDDQDVFGIGARYNGDNYWVGFGYNYGKDPIKVLGGSENPMLAYSNQAVDMFNNHLFPAVVESHYTVGGGYAIGKNMMLEGALVYAAKRNKTVDTTAVSSMMAMNMGAPQGIYPSSHTTKHSQLGITVSLRTNF